MPADAVRPVVTRIFALISSAISVAMDMPFSFGDVEISFVGR
jgi:hypothetical protein